MLTRFLLSLSLSLSLVCPPLNPGFLILIGGGILSSVQGSFSPPSPLILKPKARLLPIRNSTSGCVGGGYQSQALKCYIATRPHSLDILGVEGGAQECTILNEAERAGGSRLAGAHQSSAENY